MNELKKYNETVFENIKHVDEYGNEYWLARELQTVLDYKEWGKFKGVIKKAQEACLNSKISINDHFVGVDKMIELAKMAKRIILDYKLSRYACYLIVQNSNPKKEVVALGQTYFAVQTRRQELNEKEYSMLTKGKKRLIIH